ncbi:MAG: cytochrome P450 [Deltaproteobacteria bacterium]|nr:cytochrome P450 [Deltaproteobacteria bacterium]MBW2667890.1 cytochrome P450 [Deltaproteobacteria bacterium]
MNSSTVDLNFADVANWGQDLNERLYWLCENEPVYWSEKSQLWILTGYDVCCEVSKNQAIFTSAHGVRPKQDTVIGFIDEAEPRHGILRKMINKGFTPRMVKQLEEKFRLITREAIDQFASKGECDFVEAFSVPLPIRLIAHMMGIREEDRDRFHQWSDDLIAADGQQDKPEIMARSAKAFVEYSQYVSEIIEDRRQNPKEDLVSILTGARDDGLLDKKFEGVRTLEGQAEELQGMVNDELLVLLLVIMVAGNETTRNGISGGMQYLIQNPGERQKLIDNPALIPAAVEEMVRIVTPVKSFSRSVLEDTELRGHKIEKGQEVLIVYSAANHDARAFENPEEFRIDRNPAHIGFGIGSHFCMGANLARMEMRVAFEEILRRLPDMEFSRGGPEFRNSNLVRSCMHMWVKYTPESA